MARLRVPSHEPHGSEPRRFSRAADFELGSVERRGTELLRQKLGYVQIDPRGAEVLFQIITEREERASIALASNLPFSRMGLGIP